MFLQKYAEKQASIETNRINMNIKKGFVKNFIEAPSTTSTMSTLKKWPIIYSANH